MADDSNEDDRTKRSGIRKDGKPYAIDNTREDGSYTVGHKRTPAATRFAKDDGRRRGRRRKGGKNLMTDWREELSAKMVVTENGKTKKITKQRALVKAKIDRAIRKSDRAAEIALRYAEISEKREPGVQTDDIALIEAWFIGAQSTGDSDDLDDPTVLTDVGADDAAEGHADDGSANDA